ncbi:hypothetical protein CBA19C8_10600 [Paraburkholderia terrae]|nr:hypothetical protein CBA19C8_10600 [Paraburkholderia terrae]
MKTRKRLAVLPLTALISLTGQAQQAPNPADTAAAARANAEQNQQVQQQRDAQQRAQAVNAPAVRSTAPKADGFPVLPAESPCFRIDTFALDVPHTLPDAIRKQGASALPLDRFAFAREWLNHYAGQCIGKQGFDVLTKGLQQLILSRGYITTRVLLPEQDVSKGTLRVALVPGVVRHLRFASPDTRGTWKSAFPARDGDMLNLRDLEQGLEQMKRVASQDVNMKIEPTSSPGESDVVIDVKRTKPWSVVASVDNSGTRATGKLQGNLSLGLDNPLGLNDVLALSANQDLELGDKRLGSHGFNGSYSVPWGYWTATLSGNTNTYYEQIAGVNQTFVSSGNSQTAAFRLARVLSRSQNDVFGMQLQFIEALRREFYRRHRHPDTEARQHVSRSWPDGSSLLWRGAVRRHACVPPGRRWFGRDAGSLSGWPDVSLSYGCGRRESFRTFRRCKAELPVREHSARPVHERHLILYRRPDYRQPVYGSRFRWRDDARGGKGVLLAQ